MLLRNKDLCEYFRKGFRDFIANNDGTVEDPQIFWCAIKGGIKDTTTDFASHLNRTRLGKITENKM